MGTPSASMPAPALHRRRFVPRVKGRGVVTGAALGVTVVVVIAALLAPLIAPYSPNAIDLGNALAPPSSAHWMGTDSVGRDIFSRLLYGARLSLLGPLIVVLLSTAVGLPLGLAAGYLGGRVDAVLSRMWDVLLSFPSLLLAIVVVAAFGPSFLTATLALSVVYTPLVARVVRGLVLAERQHTYVAACRTLGMSEARIAFRHVLPNVSPAIVAQGTLNFGYALLDLAGLSFIGLGAQAPTADWGTMLAQGREDILLSSTEVIFPAAAIVLVAISFNLLGDSLGERLGRRR